MRLFYSSVAFCCITGLLQAPEVWGSDADLTLKALRDRAAATARLINAIEISTHIKYDFGQESDVHTYRHGNKYLVERRDLKGGVWRGREMPRTKKASAFNGKQYQSLRIGTGQLVLRSTPLPPLANDICLYPYSWLLAGQHVPRDIGSLRNDAVWDRRFTNAAIQGVASVLGRECVKVRFSVPVGRLSENSYVVCFASDLGMYPLKYERFVGTDGKLSTTCEVMSFRTFMEDGMVCVVPTRLLHQENGADGVSARVRLEIIADADTIGVNMPIDDAVFTISPERAAKIVDMDKVNERFNQRPALSAIDDASSWSLWRRIALAVSSVLLVILVTVLCARRKRRIIPGGG